MNESWNYSHGFAERLNYTYEADTQLIVSVKSTNGLEEKPYFIWNTGV